MTSQTEENRSRPGHIIIGAQSNDHTAHLAGVSSQRFFTDAEVFARVQMLVSEYYDLDVPINFWDVYNVEAEALGQEIDTPPEHIHAAVAACHTYGRLPLPENLDEIPFEMPQRESFSEFVHSRGTSIFL